MAKCLVQSTSAEDQATLVKWIFAQLALNPAVKPLSSVNAKQRDTLDRQMAVIYGRLIFSDCHKETVDALKYEGALGFQQSFSVLGQVAARGLMSNPAVVAGLQAFGKYSDKEKMNQLYKDAGLPPPTFPTSKPVK